MPNQDDAYPHRPISKSERLRREKQAREEDDTRESSYVRRLREGFGMIDQSEDDDDD